jgi:hypothetical protein
MAQSPADLPEYKYLLWYRTNDDLSKSVLTASGSFYVKGHGLTGPDQATIQYWKRALQPPTRAELRCIANTEAGDFRGYKPRSKGELEARDNDERYNIPKFTPEHERSHPKPIQDHFDVSRSSR